MEFCMFDVVAIIILGYHVSGFVSNKQSKQKKVIMFCRKLTFQVTWTLLHLGRANVFSGPTVSASPCAAQVCGCRVCSNACFVHFVLTIQ